MSAARAALAALSFLAWLFLAWPLPARADLPPQYPPSRPCTADDLHGPWKLARLWEDPPGTYTREFHAYPHQYLGFVDGEHYLSLYTPHPPGDVDQLRAQMENARAEAHASLRYVLNAKGALYLYRDKHVMASARCNVVTQRQGAFRRGQIWLYQAMSAPDIKLVRLFAPDRLPKLPKDEMLRRALQEHAPPPQKKPVQPH